MTRMAGLGKDISSFLGTKAPWDDMGGQAIQSAADEHITGFKNNALVSNSGLKAQADIASAGHYADYASASAGAEAGATVAGAGAQAATGFAKTLGSLGGGGGGSSYSPSGGWGNFGSGLFG